MLRFGSFLRFFDSELSEIVVENGSSVSLKSRFRRFGSYRSRNRLRFGNVLRSSNFSCSIAEWNDTFVSHTFFSSHTFFFKDRLHFLFIGFYHFCSDLSFTFFAGKFAQISHKTATAITSDIFGLLEIDSTASFLVVKGSVNLVVEGSSYKCNIHNDLRFHTQDNAQKKYISYIEKTCIIILMKCRSRFPAAMSRFSHLYI